MNTKAKTASTEIIARFTRAMSLQRFHLQDEKRTQVDIATVLDGVGIPYEREVHLSDADIVDFMLVGSIAIEVKIKGQRMAVYRQLERYASHERVSSIVLLTSKAMLLPKEINGKPAVVVSLSAGWL